MKKQITLEMETKGNAIKQVEELQSRVKIYEMDKSSANKEKVGEVWKAKFDEMFKISQKLIQENADLKQELQAVK